MRTGFLIASLVVAVLSPGCKPAQESSTKPDSKSALQKVAGGERTIEAGCAKCIYKMKGVSDCKLAVRIDNKPYLVTGSEIDDHGDAHAPDGLCQVARAAVALGGIEGDRFVAKKFRLKP